MLIFVMFLFASLLSQPSAVLPPSLKAALQPFVCICFQIICEITICNLADTSRLTRLWKNEVKGQSAATDLSITDLDCKM